MGEAREVMDRFNAAAFERKDFEAAAECYADGAVVVTPDQGELTGREAIVAYLRDLADPFPMSGWNTRPSMSRETWQSTSGTRSVPIPHRCRCQRVRLFRQPESKSGCEAATSPLSKVAGSPHIEFTSTKWSFSDNLVCFRTHENSGQGVSATQRKVQLTPKAPECKTLRGFRLSLAGAEPLVARRDDDRRRVHRAAADHDFDRMGPWGQRVEQRDEAVGH
jgi:SnoaL-like domain